MMKRSGGLLDYWIGEGWVTSVGSKGSIKSSCEASYFVMKSSRWHCGQCQALTLRASRLMPKAQAWSWRSMVMSIGVGLTQTLFCRRQPRVISQPQSRQVARARDSTGRLRGAVPQEAVRFMDVLVSVLTGKP